MQHTNIACSCAHARRVRVLMRVCSCVVRVSELRSVKASVLHMRVCICVSAGQWREDPFRWSAAATANEHNCDHTPVTGGTGHASTRAQ
jgi:hypothetical protein